MGIQRFTNKKKTVSLPNSRLNTLMRKNALIEKMEARIQQDKHNKNKSCIWK